jgi:hypothetical protein
MPETTATILSEVSTRPDIKPHCYVVGAWIWAEFESMPMAETRLWLTAHGFRWNAKRRVWQNPCGIHRGGAPYDPRAKYGVVTLDD